MSIPIRGIAVRKSVLCGGQVVWDLTRIWPALCRSFIENSTNLIKSDPEIKNMKYHFINNFLCVYNHKKMNL